MQQLTVFRGKATAPLYSWGKYLLVPTLILCLGLRHHAEQKAAVVFEDQNRNLQKASTGFAMTLKLTKSNSVQADLRPYHDTQNVRLKWIMTDASGQVLIQEQAVASILALHNFEFILPLDIDPAKRPTRVVAQVSGTVEQRTWGSADVLDLAHLNSAGTQLLELGPPTMRMRSSTQDSAAPTVYQ